MTRPAALRSFDRAALFLALIFLPLLQAVAILLAFLAAMAFGWRMRPDFLED